LLIDVAPDIGRFSGFQEAVIKLLGIYCCDETTKKCGPYLVPHK
jgi:hypothetical protein